MAFTTVLNTTRLVGLIGNFGSRSQKNVDDTAKNIRERASQLAPRLTGSLAESIYVSTPNVSEYSGRVASARSLNPLAIVVPEVTSDEVLSLGGTSPNAYVDVVGVGVQHGIYNELGTRYMAPQPFLFPAVEPEREAFVSLMTHVADA